jgi:hypothetical protein
LEGFFWVLFFVVVVVLKILGAIVETLQGPKQDRLPNQPQRPRPRPRSPVQGGERPRQPNETPFQAMLRMLEEAAEAQQAEERRLQQRFEQRDVRVARPVARAEKAELVPFAPAESDHGGDVAERHLKSKVGERHLRSKIGEKRLRSKLADRHVPHLEHETHVEEVFEHQARGGDQPSFQDRLAILSPLQQAVIWSEVLGKPRYQRRGAPYASR